MPELKKMRLSLKRYYRFDSGLEKLCLRLRPEESFGKGTDVLEYLMTVHAVTLRLSALLDRAQWDYDMEELFRRESGADSPTSLEDSLREARNAFSEHYFSFRKSLGSVIEEGMDVLGIRKDGTRTSGDPEVWS